MVLTKRTYLTPEPAAPSFPLSPFGPLGPFNPGLPAGPLEPGTGVLVPGFPGSPVILSIQHRLALIDLQTNRCWLILSESFYMSIIYGWIYQITRTHFDFATHKDLKITSSDERNCQDQLEKVTKAR